jgi:signal transduction histidine kinase
LFKPRIGDRRLAAPAQRTFRSEEISTVPAKRKTERHSKPREPSLAPAAGRAQELSQLLHQLDSLRDDERKLLSRDLHDTLVASLSATKMECDYLLRSGAAVAADPDLKRRLTRVSGALGEAIHYARRVIDRLWPAAVSHLGIASALLNHLEELRSSSQFEISANVESDLGELPERHAMMLYRTAVEVLAFCVGHNPPLRPHLQLRRSDGGVELTIENNGVAQATAQSARFDASMIRERAEHLGGAFALGGDGAMRFQLRLFLPG